MIKCCHSLTSVIFFFFQVSCTCFHKGTTLAIRKQFLSFLPPLSLVSSEGAWHPISSSSPTHSLLILPLVGSQISQKTDSCLPCVPPPSFATQWGFFYKPTSQFWPVLHFKRMILEQLQILRTFPEVTAEQNYNSRTVIPSLGW